MDNKKFILRFVAIAALPLVLILALNYMIDPLQLYRRSSIAPSFFVTQQRFQFPGVARNFAYDTVVIGSSMSENALPAHINNTLGVNSINLAFAAAASREQKLLAQVAINTGQVKNLIWEINFDSISAPPETVRDQFGPFPFHLYDRNPFNDLNYLLNKDTLEMSLDIVRFIRGMKDLPERDVKTMYSWHPLVTYGKDLVLQKWEEAKRGPRKIDPESFGKMTRDNLEQNIISVVRANPQINFYIYYPPFSILKQRHYYEGNPLLFENNLMAKEYVFERLGGLDHVKIFDPQADERITFDLDRYKDLSHYDQRANEQIIEAFVTGEYLVDDSNSSQVIEKLRKQVETLDMLLFE